MGVYAHVAEHPRGRSQLARHVYGVAGWRYCRDEADTARHPASRLHKSRMCRLKARGCGGRARVEAELFADRPLVDPIGWDHSICSVDHLRKTLRAGKDFYDDQELNPRRSGTATTAYRQPRSGHDISVHRVAKPAVGGPAQKRRALMSHAEHIVAGQRVVPPPPQPDYGPARPTASGRRCVSNIIEAQIERVCVRWHV